MLSDEPTLVTSGSWLRTLDQTHDMLMTANHKIYPVIIGLLTVIPHTGFWIHKSYSDEPNITNGVKVLKSAPPAKFDYHQIRGRKSKLSETGILEGELDFSFFGTSRFQEMSSFGSQWSNNAHLLWDGQISESMTTSFEVEAAGLYDISIQLTQAGDYGIFRMSLAQSSITQEIDLYNPRVELAPLLVLKDIKLDAGPQSIEFKLIGANPKARKFQNRGYLMGLDYLQLTRKDQQATSQTQDLQEVGVPKIEPSDDELPGAIPNPGSEPFTDQQISEFTSRFCLDCHDGESTDSDIKLVISANVKPWYRDPNIIRKVRDELADHNMPPADSEQPPVDQRQAIVRSLNIAISKHLNTNPEVAPSVMRRMTRYEYNNSVRDLLKLSGDIYPLPEKTLRASSPYFQPATGHSPRSILVGNRTLGKNQIERQILTGVSPFAIDLQAEGGFNNRGDDLGVSPIFVESLVNLGRSIVHSPEFDGYCGVSESLFTSPDLQNEDQVAKVAFNRIARLLERAFRSPIDAPTTQRYHLYFLSRHKETQSFKMAMKDTVAAILASPRFVYLAETVPQEKSKLLGAYEMATRLSMFLWSSIPDEELLTAARNGSLLDTTVLDSQTNRMLIDPKSHALTQNFARQWLRLDQLITAVPDFERFPEYYSRIGCEQWKFGLQMMVEPLLLFDSIMLEDRSIMLLIDSNYSYRSDELQSWYTEKIPFNNRDNRNRFNTNTQRYTKRRLDDRREGGVITSAATMTMTSSPLRTNPITRGAWVATVILNRPPPPPPDTVPPIEADDRQIESSGLTLRQRLTQHQQSPECAACHSQLDPLGFALENYDAVGRWRQAYASGLEIDSSGELFGKLKFSNVVEFKDALLEHPDLFTQAFSEHLLSYALGRELTLKDENAVKTIVEKSLETNGQFTTIVRAIVRSRPFRYHGDESEEAQ